MKQIGNIEGVSAGVKRCELIATVTRADGTVEELGVIASKDYTKKNILQRLGDLLCHKN